SGGAARADARPLGAARRPRGRARCPAPPYRGAQRPPGRGVADDEILTTLADRLDDGRPFAGAYDIGNHHLTVGARIAGRFAERVGNAGLAPGSIRLRFRGSAGQSFGAFALPGMRLELEGEANDYVGKRSEERRVGKEWW